MSSLADMAHTDSHPYPSNSPELQRNSQIQANPHLDHGVRVVQVLLGDLAARRIPVDAGVGHRVQLVTAAAIVATEKCEDCAAAKGKSEGSAAVCSRCWRRARGTARHCGSKNGISGTKQLCFRAMCEKAMEQLTTNAMHCQQPKKCSSNRS